MALTKQQKLFVNEYLIDLNATRAYKMAYPSCKKDESAAANGSRLLRIAKVEDYIQERMKKREKRTEITQDRVLKELAKIGFADITDFVMIDGSYVKVRPTSEIPPDKIGAIAGIKEGANGIEVKLNSKDRALELIGRHLGMWKDKVEMSGNVNINNPYAGLTTDELKKLIDDG